MAYGDKQCKDCSVLLNGENRYTSGSHRCKTCEKEYKKVRYASRRDEFKAAQLQRHYDNREESILRMKAWQLKTKYGLTLDDVERMQKEQDGKCAICKEILDAICVDHNHTTGKVRGLLCSYCNKGLGFFRDNVKSLASAIVYLEEQKVS